MIAARMGEERMGSDMEDVSFEEDFQSLLLLSGIEEGTVEFMAAYRRILARTQEVAEFARNEEEGELVGVFVAKLKRVLMEQEKFLQTLRERVLAEMWPDEKPEQPETLN